MKTYLMIFLVSLFAASHVTEPDAEEISRKSLEITEIDAMELTSTLRIFDPKGRERVRKTFTVSKKFGETTKIITKFIAPADVKGIGLLVYDYSDKNDDMWIYLPALHKIRRIVSSEKGKSFMGSEFSNADMSKPNIDDYNYTLIGSEDFNEKACWKIESIPRSEKMAEEYGFSKKTTLIDKNTFFIYKVSYYDLNGELQKEMIISDYKELGNNKVMASQMEITNVQKNRKSVLTIDQLQIGSNLSEDYFTPARLEK